MTSVSDIPGQLFAGDFFLYAFPVLMLFTIFSGAVWVRRGDNSEKDGPLPPKSLNAFEIAFLQNGVNAMIRTAICALWDRKYIRFSEPSDDKGIWNHILGIGTRKEKTCIERADERQDAPDDPVLKKVYDFIDKPRKISELLSGSLATYLGILPLSIHEKLEKLNILEDREMKRRRRLAFWAIFFLLFGMAGTKVYFLLDQNLFELVSRCFFLIPESLVLLFVLVATLGSGVTPISQRGKKYLESLKKQFEFCKKGNSSDWGVGPEIPAAIFGIGILAQLSDFQDISTAIGSGHNSGGCGGGCGGCGDGDGGGGCGDGGCSGGCGGGCGGGGCGG